MSPSFSLALDDRPRSPFAPTLIGNVPFPTRLEVLPISRRSRARGRPFSLHLNCDTRSACSRMTRALSLARVPVGSPLYIILGLDQKGMRWQPPHPSLYPIIVRHLVPLMYPCA